MKKMKRLVSITLSLAMVMAALAGCGTESKEQSAPASSAASSTPSSSQSAQTDAEAPSYSVTRPLRTEFHLEDNIAYKKFIEITGLKIDEIVEIPSAEIEAKYPLMFAGEDYTDFFWSTDGMDVDKYGMEGYLVPVEDLIREYMPNLSEILDERNAWREMKAPDGHMYGIPGIATTIGQGTTSWMWLINQTWLDKLGLDMPTSPEELYDVLKAFKEQDPNGNGVADEIPFMPSNPQWENFAAFFGGMQHYIYEDVAIKDGEMIYYPYTEENKELLAWFAKCYEEGLIYEEFVTKPDSEMSAMRAEADIVGLYGGWGLGTVYNERDFVVMQPFDPDNYTRVSGVYKNGYAISDKCEDPGTLLAALDYFYDFEGSTLYRLGIEGESYKFNEDGSWDWCWEENGYTDKSQVALSGGTSGCRNGYDYANANKETSYGTWLDGQNGLEGGIWTKGVILPGLIYTEDEADRRSTLTVDLGGYLGTYYVEIITGAKDLDTTWEEHQQTLKNMGSDEYLELMKGAYKRATE